MTGMADQRLVRDVMSEATQTIQAGQTLVAARQRMQGDMRVKSLIVVEGDRAIGLVRYNDINRDDVAGSTVADAMLADVPTAREDQPLSELTGVMTEYDIDRLPVVGADGRLVGEVQRTALTLGESHAGEAMTGREALSDAIADRDTPVYDIKADMTVLGAQGSKIGKVKEVLADNLSGSLTHLVVHTGLLFGKDKSVPADLVDHVEGDEVHLKVTKSEIDMLPDLGAEA